MGAIKKINTTGLLSDALTSGADVIVKSFRIYGSDGVTQKTNTKDLTTQRTLSAGGKLSIADEAFYITAGTQGADGIAGRVGEPTNAQLVIMLDTVFADGDKIEWVDSNGTLLSSISGGSGRLAQTTVADWDGAIAWT